MAKYLIRTTEVYRTDSEKEARDLVEEEKKSSVCEVIKSTIETRVAKQKGEIVDEWRRVTITKVFDEEKEPYGSVMPQYVTPNFGGTEIED